VCGLAGQFHPRFINAVMSGNGLAGVVISAIQLAIMVIVPENADALVRGAQTTQWFFGACGVVIVLAIVSFLFLLMKSPVTAHYLRESPQERLEFITGQESGSARSPFMVIVKTIAVQAFNVMFVFLVTLTLYPAIATLIVPVSYDYGKIPFFVVLVTIFNVGDFVGRSMPRIDALVVITRKWLWLPIAARIVFVPLFVLSVHPRLIVSDLATYFIMFAFALSNGYLGTLAMMYGPVPLKPQDKEMGGTLMVFALTIGLTGGVWLGKLIDVFFQ